MIGDTVLELWGNVVINGRRRRVRVAGLIRASNIVGRHITAGMVLLALRVEGTSFIGKVHRHLLQEARTVLAVGRHVRALHRCLTLVLRREGAIVFKVLVQGRACPEEGLRR